MASAQLLLCTPWHFRGRGKVITDCEGPYQGRYFTRVTCDLYFPWIDTELELYSVLARFLVLNELVLVVGLWLPNVCSAVKGP